MEPAVRFHHIYEVDGDPDRFDVTFQTYTQQHAYQMKLLTSIAYGSTTINIDYQDGSDSEHYNYAKAINIRDNGTLIRKINLEQHQGILHYHGSGNLPFSTLDKITLLGSNGITSETYQCGYINEIFRIMHTIKGSSAMMGFENLQHLAHKGEDMFFVIREKPEIAKDAHFVYELIFEVSDLYKAEIEYIQNSGDDDYTPTDFSETFKKLEDATERLKAMESGAAPAESAPAECSRAPRWNGLRSS